MSTAAPVTPYMMCVRNVANHLRTRQPRSECPPDLVAGDPKLHTYASIDAFEASIVLGIAFAKLPEDVISDIVMVKLEGT